MDIVEWLRYASVIYKRYGYIHRSKYMERAADEIERFREQELKMTAHALAQMEEIERLRKFIKEHDMAEVLEDWENS